MPQADPATQKVLFRDLAQQAKVGRGLVLKEKEVYLANSSARSRFGTLLRPRTPRTRKVHRKTAPMAVNLYYRTSMAFGGGTVNLRGARDQERRRRVGASGSVRSRSSCVSRRRMSLLRVPAIKTSLGRVRAL
jgi:hypothetical protein